MNFRQPALSTYSKDINKHFLIGLEIRYVIKTRERDKLSHDFFSLVMGPSLNVRSYTGCIMGTMSNFPAGFDESDYLFNFNAKKCNTVLDTSSIGDTSGVQGAEPPPFKKFNDPEQARANPLQIEQSGARLALLLRPLPHSMISGVLERSSGSKSFLQRQHKLAEQRGHPIDNVELFRKTHAQGG
ncbi:CACTA en-spm transposon protein [Cucumis melo var. makuwa]|uniref:CACTA en-spm transposon protein n=1 Tax=Cucumis melo var. makuwa TaxID=1194695 RepID=A0A5D3DBD7_CUCMM|nr:CACTA en-spm transposon protein [Cucumis melo var. makuwa]TYK20865.1 CACTA en-spm transposon protein [Cucumis melo var. makuwa]